MNTPPVERSSVERTSRCTDWRRLVRSKLLSFATTTKPNKASRTPTAASTKRCFQPVLCRSASFVSCFSKALARRCEGRLRRPRVRANSPASKNGPAANRSWRNTRRSKKVAASARIKSYRCSIPGLAGFTKSPSPTAITEKPGGESGIRTRGTLSDTQAFQACTLNHSVISPDTKRSPLGGGGTHSERLRA